MLKIVTNINFFYLFIFNYIYFHVAVASGALEHK